jgi:hypothetical protein
MSFPLQAEKKQRNNNYILKTQKTRSCVQVTAASGNLGLAFGQKQTLFLVCRNEEDLLQLWEMSAMVQECIQ